MSTPSSDGARPAFLPYIGIRRDHRPGETVRIYSSDQSGTKTYTFNSLGYRGEEFDPKAKKHIFVFGCSNTFGVGLDFEETWAHQFRVLCAKHWGLAPSEVNLLLFAEAAASNDFIARTLVSECSAFAPDLVVASFTYFSRKEYLSEGEIFPMMPWWASDEEVARSAQSIAALFGEDERGKRRQKEVFEVAKSFYHYFSTETAIGETLRNMLLCHGFCASRGITYLQSWVESSLVDKPSAPRPFAPGLTEAVTSRTILPLVAAVKAIGVVPFGQKDQVVDKAADGGHPGPQTAEMFAQLLFERFKGAAK